MATKKKSVRTATKPVAKRTVTSTAKQAAKKADGFAKKNPWIVAGAAAGVGLALGLLTKGRGKKKK